MNVNQHISPENMIGFVYRTLNDADRETIEAHLSNCPVCRAKVSQHEQQQHRLGSDLKADLNIVPVPKQLTFAAIRPRLERRGLQRMLPQIANTAPLLAAALGLVMAVFGVWQVAQNMRIGIQLAANQGTYPALACFFLMFVSMDQFDRAFSIRPRFIVTVVLAFTLWLGSFFIGLLNIIVIRDLAIAIFIFGGGSPEGASVVAILAVMIAAMFCIGVIIGGAEYHYKNIGHPSSWKLFSWTIFIQLFIMVLPYLIL